MKISRMKTICCLISAILMTNIQYAEAAQSECETLHDKCSILSKEINSTNHQNCSECRDVCKKAQKTCAQDHKKLEEVSTYLLYCKNTCLK